MNKHFIYSAALFIAVGIGTLFTRHYGWYSAYWFTDVILHTISGMGFALIWIGTEEKKNQTPWILLLGAVSFATLGSVLWEFWEFAGWHITPSHARFYIPELGDSLSDIFCGMAGSLLAASMHLLFKRK